MAARPAAKEPGPIVLSVYEVTVDLDELRRADISHAMRFLKTANRGRISSSMRFPKTRNRGRRAKGVT